MTKLNEIENITVLGGEDGMLATEIRNTNGKCWSSSHTKSWSVSNRATIILEADFLLPHLPNEFSGHFKHRHCQFGLVVVSNPIPWYQSQLCAVLQEHIACSLLRVDPNAIVSDNCTERAHFRIRSAFVCKPCSRVNLELFSCIFENSCERSSFWYPQYLKTRMCNYVCLRFSWLLKLNYLEGKLWVRGKGDLEGDLSCCWGSHSLQRKDS